ncbi:MAG: response regulator [Candidatus Acidiferrales bacterium]
MNSMAATGVESVLSGRYVTSQISEDNEAPTVLIVTLDSEVRDALAEILDGRGVNIECARGVEAARGLLAAGGVAACLCGFGLEDGSYKDLVKQAKRQMPEVPVIIVSTPSCPNEYREYLAAMNTGAFDFLCHPYQKREVERILRLAVTSSRRIDR